MNSLCFAEYIKKMSKFNLKNNIIKGHIINISGLKMIVKLNLHDANGRILAKGYKYEIKDCKDDGELKAQLFAKIVDSFHKNALSDISYDVNWGIDEKEALKKVIENMDKKLGSYFTVENKPNVKISIKEVDFKVTLLLTKCCEKSEGLYIDPHLSENEAKELVMVYNATACKSCGKLPKSSVLA